MEMTPEVLRDACKANGGYSQPHLNDQLYLQCKGFTKIQSLEKYTAVKVLWLEQNGIMDIEGIGHMERMVSLFLQNNTIRRISGLEGLRNLRILNLSNNFITKIDGLADTVPLLETLQLAHNQIATLGDCAEIRRLENLSSVDLSFNRIDIVGEVPVAEGEESTEVAVAGKDGEIAGVIGFFRPMEELSVIYLHGNTLTHGMRNYRKNMIAGLPKLTYLDERPVFEDERSTVMAWKEGGAEKEAEKRNEIRQAKLDELTRCTKAMNEMANEKRELREQREKEWQAMREQQLEREKAERTRIRTLCNGLENEEDDARGELLVEETDAWMNLVTGESDSKASTIVEDAKRQEREDVEAVVRKEIEAEQAEAEKRIAAARATSPSKSDRDESEAIAAQSKSSVAPAASRDEMEYWLRELEKTDDEVVDGMQQDLEAFLSELQPGVYSAAARTAAKQPQAGRPAPAKVAAPAHVDPLADTSNKPVVEKKKPAPAKKGGFSKFDVWERYHALEEARERSRN